MAHGLHAHPPFPFDLKSDLLTHSILSHFYLSALREGQLSNPRPLLVKSMLFLPAENDASRRLPDATPVLEVLQNGELVFSSSMRHAGCKLVEEADMMSFHFEQLVLCGSVEVVLLACHDDVDHGRRQQVTMRYFFHTGFVAEGLVRVSERDLELTAARDELRFTPGSLDMALVSSSLDAEVASYRTETWPLSPLTIPPVRLKPQSVLKDTEAVLSQRFNAQPTLEEAVGTLTQAHVVVADASVVEGLQQRGVPMARARLALQLLNNDAQEAHLQCDRWSRFEYWSQPLTAQESQSVTLSDLMAGSSEQGRGVGQGRSMPGSVVPSMSGSMGHSMAGSIGQPPMPAQSGSGSTLDGLPSSGFASLTPSQGSWLGLPDTPASPFTIRMAGEDELSRLLANTDLSPAVNTAETQLRQGQLEAGRRR